MDHIVMPNHDKAMATPVAKWLHHIGFMSSVSEAKRALKERSVKVNAGLTLTEEHYHVQATNDDGSPWMAFLTIEQIAKACGYEPH